MLISYEKQGGQPINKVVGHVVFIAYLIKKGKIAFDKPTYSSIAGTSFACKKKMKILGYNNEDYFVHRCFLKI